MCPGMRLANIALALLWSFRIVERPRAPIDTPSDKDNIQSHPPRFEVKFMTRIGTLKRHGQEK